MEIWRILKMNKPKMNKTHTWICERCNATFTNHNDYIKHRAGHQTGRIDDEPIKNPSGDTTEVPQKENKAEEVVQKPTKKTPLKEKVPKSFKIDLKYVYEGRCDCGEPVKTLEFDVGSDNLKNRTHLVVAYCMKCNKAIRERVVKKL